MSFIVNRVRVIFATTFFVIFFSFQGYGVTYYVNDNSTTGDIYCSAVGNNGTGTGSQSNPYLTVSYVINNKTLGAGDIVYIDAGNYNEGWVLNSNADGGSAGNPLTFQGAGVSLTKNIYTSSQGIAIGNGSGAGNSYITFKDVYVETTQNVNTVYVNAGTSNIIFNSCSFKSVVSGAAIVFMSASSCRVISCSISTVYNGIDSYNGSNQIFDGNTITHASAYTAGQNHLGIIVEGTTSFPAPYLADNCVISSNRVSGFNYGFYIQQEGTGNTWKNNYVWATEYGLFCPNSTYSHASNTFKFNSILSDKDCIYGACLSWDIQSNILYSNTRNCITLLDASNDPSTMNYNLYYAPSGNIGSRNGTTYATLAAWKAALSKDVNSLSGNPLFSSTTVLDITGSSPAIGLAGTDAGVTDDVRRNPTYTRPTSNKDIGAFQYSSAVLPVELIDFSAFVVDGGNEVSWVTGTEINNDYFTLERSHDGINFSAIHYEKGAGSSNSIINYSYVDNAKSTGIVYYRLKQTDYDGTFCYSKVVAVESKNSNNFSFLLYPNPSNGSTISFVLPENKASSSLEIYDALGKIIFSEKLTSQSHYILEWSEKPAAGVYFVTLKSGDQSFNQKLIVE
ncbi:MAG: T9SS type A sorting domain-containing protein [Bacteroidetes bacterium]|nr:T9SS type A sorting domain-containing protein [Bacteroidota bacterium]